MSPSQQTLFIVLFDATHALGETLPEPITLSFHGDAAGEALSAWAAARGIELQRSTIQLGGAAPWTRLVVLFGFASCIEVHLGRTDGGGRATRS